MKKITKYAEFYIGGSFISETVVLGHTVYLEPYRSNTLWIMLSVQ